MFRSCGKHAEEEIVLVFKHYLEDFHEIIHYIVVTYTENNRHVKPGRFSFTESKSSTVWGNVYANKGDNTRIQCDDPFKNENHSTDIKHAVIRTGRYNDELVIRSLGACFFSPISHLSEEVLTRVWQTIYILCLYSGMKFCACNWISL